jgi:hypothetical protein
MSELPSASLSLPQRMESRVRALDSGLDTLKADDLIDELFRNDPNNGPISVVQHEGRLLVRDEAHLLCEVPVQLAKPKLRSICGRLAAKCGEWTGTPVSTSGATVDVEHPLNKRRYRVEFANTSSVQQISVVAVPGPQAVKPEVVRPSAIESPPSNRRWSTIRRTLLWSAGPLVGAAITACLLLAMPYLGTTGLGGKGLATDFNTVVPFDEYDRLRRAPDDQLGVLMLGSSNKHVVQFVEKCGGDPKCLRAAVEELICPDRPR